MYNQVSILRHHIYKATEQGADFHELCRRMKVTPEQLRVGEGYIHFEPGDGTDFWRNAVELTGDQCLGLHLGQLPNNNSFGMLGMLATSCKTIGEAIQTIVKFNDTLTDSFKFDFKVNDKEAIYSFDPHPLLEKAEPVSARQSVYMQISSWVRAIHDVAVKKFDPIRVTIRYEKRFIEEYHKIIEGEILFNQPSNTIVFSKASLDTPLITYDESLFVAFTNLLKQKQTQLDNRKTLTARIRHLLLTEFQGQMVNIDILASSLHMTTRTLQRKLAEENTSYRDISADLRKELAEGLLRTGKSRKSEIASILGYADLSTFSKALKSWELG